MFSSNAEDFFSGDNIGFSQIHDTQRQILLNPMGTGSFKQIDLNDAQNLADLEDPSLIEHMANARQRLLDAEIKNKLSKENINVKMIEASRAIVLVNRQIKSVHNTLSLSLENLLLQTLNIDKLTNDETPHGFPKIRKNLSTTLQVKDWEANITHLGKKIIPINESLTENIETIIALEKDILLISRNYQLIIGELFDFNEQIIQENSDLIKEFLPEEKEVEEKVEEVEELN